jgi:hypothetical protein
MKVKNGRRIGIVTGFLDPNEKSYFVGISWFNGGTDWFSPTALWDHSMLIGGKPIDPSDC